MISAPETALGRGHSIHAMTRTMKGREGTNYIKKTDHRWFRQFLEVLQKLAVKG